MTATEKELRVIAVGTWLYDGLVSRETELYRDIDPDTGEPRYHVGGSSGSFFTTVDEAKSWAGRQPWGPMTWRDADYSVTILIVDDGE